MKIETFEIFNVIFLNFPSIQETIGAEELLFYPDLKDKLERVNEIWTKEKKSERFIKSSLEYLKSKN